MIILCGPPTDAPLAMLRRRLTEGGVRYVGLQEEDFDRISIQYRVDRGRVIGCLGTGGQGYPLEDFSGVYLRMSAPRQVQIEESFIRRRKQQIDTFMAWCEIAPCRVISRPAVAAANGSKTYQLQSIRRQGFKVPETLVTNDPDMALAFIRDHERVVYKSMSGNRSVVRAVNESDLNRLSRILWCPTQFQTYVAGTNVRVHVVEGRCFATEIRTHAVDYRDPDFNDVTPPTLLPTILPDDVRQRCIRLAAALELPFAGIDLKVEPTGQVVCFEVNPSPAFTFYEDRTGQSISRALAEYIAKPIGEPTESEGDGTP